jgi:hypothetical protein
VTLPKLSTRPPDDVVESWPESAQRYVRGLERVLCGEIDGLAPRAEVVAAQHLADRISAMLTKLFRSTKVALD